MCLLGDLGVPPSSKFQGGWADHDDRDVVKHT